MATWPSHRLTLAALLLLGAALPVNFGAEVERPTVARKLVDELFLGNDPMLAPSARREQGMVPEEGMTHVSARDITMVLSMATQPVTFWLELGSFEGGSAILAARQAAAAGSRETSVVAVDTFLGDARVLWERPPEERKRLLRADGTISLFDRFRANILRAGVEATVLPIPATSVVALKLAASLAHRGVTPLPQVIYLDSAHEEGEVLLELRLAWQALAPGGVLFGDDWVLPEWQDEAFTTGLSTDGGAVQRDVLRFAAEVEADLDDDFGRRAQPLRTLGRARPGLFVSYNSFQWFVRKLPNATARPVAWSGGESSVPSAGFVCWSDGFQEKDCCDEAQFGQGGNPKCWDLVFTFSRCCPGAA